MRGLGTAAAAFGILFAAACEEADAVGFEERGQALEHTEGFWEEGAAIGEETALARRLSDGEEFSLSIPELVSHGERVFSANFTVQDGFGRPNHTGTGAPLADPSSPLEFPRNMNRISGPDANSCAGCHNAPFGIAGGGGDFVTNVFVLGQRFDFVTFDHHDPILTRGALNEVGEAVTLDDVSNNRRTLGMFGSGYIELLAIEMTQDLQAIRDSLLPGDAAYLETKGVDFGVLSRRSDGTWDTSAVEGIAPPSLVSLGADDPPSMIIRPFHQAGAVISLRQFTNNAFNHHHGIQAAERFGDDVPDAMSRADITAASVMQAAMAVPGRVIPRQGDIEEAIEIGEQLFEEIGCETCHRAELPLESDLFVEPNPFNPPGNLQPGDAPDLVVDLGDRRLPTPRLEPDADGRVYVPAFTDLKLHDITDGPDDPNAEPLNMHFAPGSPEFFAGNTHFLTKKLWGVGNSEPYFHHGKFTTMREAILAHAGDAEAERQAFESLSDYERDAIIEFLKSLRVLPPGTRHAVVDERGAPRPWPHSGR